MKLSLFVLCLYFPIAVFARHVYPEKYYQSEYAKTLSNAELKSSLRTEPDVIFLLIPTL